MNLPSFKVRGVLAILALGLPLSLVGITVQEHKAQAQQQAAAGIATSLPDGIYLYGDTPQPEQIQHNYVVFEVDQGNAVGAFYAPYSEFACFTGEQQGNQLEVSTLSFNEVREVEATAQLNELHPIDAYSANDRRMLSICKQDMANATL